MRRSTMLGALVAVAVPALGAMPSGCSRAESGARWSGTVDTLPSGAVVVSNPARGLWRDDDRPLLVEDLRIGSLEETGPRMFGEIVDFAVDSFERIWVLEGQAQELRVFGPDGSHIRTVGRRGGGPGEFNRAIGMEWSPDGDLWVVDPANNRISVVDTAGNFVATHPAIGGIIVQPWPGGFDSAGSFYSYGIRASAREDDIAPLVMVRYGPDLQPIDSVAPPRETDRPVFELHDDRNWWITPIPFTPGIEWRLRPEGGFRALSTGDYRLVDLAWSGDTVRVVSREFQPLPVTGADLDRALANLEDFMKNGGRVDRSRIPDTKPPVTQFFTDPGGRTWVLREPRDEADRDRLFDVFDSGGRYLGELRSPFPVTFYPAPVVHDGHLYAVSRDELEVPYVVRARIESPEDESS